ncbi:MAG TPA: hypothetical protein PLB02_04830 [Thermoanaerobaculia bacterium]|nr:hypothetical protein [Thermoanaerobaculia bacterium]HQR66697.1 hypothetical protein [Thermoanaerobaculia bacterium]
MSSSPKWFRPVAVVALIWNLLGCLAYLADVRISPERLARMTPAQQALYAARPSWAVAATATAVWFGAAGCVGLVMRRKWAGWLLVVSLLGVVAQDLWLFGLSGSARAAGPPAFVVQGLVLVVSVALVLLARRAARESWLS